MQRQRIGSQDWNTPPEVLEPLAAFLPITLDPCSNASSIVPATVRIMLPDDGLYVPWHRFGHTFLNPPYNDLPAWLCKAAVERVLFEAPTITALVPAAVETAAFRQFVFGTADAIGFWKRRVTFGGKSGNTLPSALCYWGPETGRFREHFAPYATVITDWT